MPRQKPCSTHCIYVLWDESQLWGLLLARALRHMRVPHRLVSARQVAAGLLSDATSGSPAALLVPGGFARRKARALGPKGIEAVRGYVHGGGVYLGFCGGAGLGLSGDNGLELCPWTRKGFADRLQHFASGHVHVTTAQNHDLVPEDLRDMPLLPVWWPARFSVTPHQGVRVLAAYADPGPDFMVADIPLAALPAETMNDWQALYGVKLWPQVMHGQPAIIEAAHGDGRVVLSYAHLETPASPEANAWLTHLLTRLTDVRPASGLIPAWDLETLPVEWDDPALTRAAGQMAEIVRLGREHLLLYWRNPWLLGWRRGIPGAALSSLTAFIRQISAHEPGNDALDFWSQASVEFTRHMDLFHRGLTGYLLAERLAMTLSAANDAECLPGLAQQKQALFGPPPAGGGLYARLSAPLERLARRVLDTPPTGCE